MFEMLLPVIGQIALAVIKGIMILYVIFEIVFATLVLIFPNMRKKFLDINNLENTTLLIFILTFIKVNLTSEQQLPLTEYIKYRKKLRGKRSENPLPPDVTNVYELLQYKREQKQRGLIDLIDETKKEGGKITKGQPKREVKEQTGKTGRQDRAEDFIKSSKDDINELF